MWNTTKLQLLAASILMKDDNIFKDAMDKAFMLSEEHPEDAEKLLQENSFDYLFIKPVNTAEILTEEGTPDVCALSDYARVNLKTKSVFIDMVKKVVENKMDTLGNIDYNIANLYIDVLNHMKENGKLPNTANGFISLGFAFSELSKDIEHLKHKRKK